MFRSLKAPIGSAVDDELEFHIATRTDALIAAGMAEADARHRAIAEFGDVRDARSALVAIDRRTRSRRVRAEWWRDVVQDARVATRGYLRRPAFTIAVVLTLGVAIGANGAVFSVAETVLFRGLPYREAHQLTHLWETVRDDPSQHTEASYPDFLDWRSLSDVFDAVEGYNETNVTVSGPAGAARIKGARVTAGFFRMLGSRFPLGRSFAADEDRPDGAPVVVLSHAYWQRELGADRTALNRVITIDAAPYTIIGVLPPEFRFAPVGDAELWFPLGGSAQRRDERFNHWVNVVARLHPGVTSETANARLGALMARLGAQYPETNAGRGALAVPLRDAIIGPVQPLMAVLLGGSLIVLLVACANVASLVLARAMERRDEIAVRAALGASRMRLMRQLVSENALLAVAGGALGWLIAAQLVTAIVHIVPAPVLDQMPQLHDVRPNGVVFLVTLGLTALAGATFGLVPAAFLTRWSSFHLLRGARAGASRAKGRVRDALVTLEIACTIVLVVSAMLLGRSVGQLMRVDTGFNAAQVASARIALAGPRYNQGIAQQRFFEEVLRRLRETPGTVAVGAVSNPPLQGGGTNTFRVEGLPEPPASNRPEATMRGVAGDYFAVMGIEVVDGRPLTSQDDSTARPAVVVSEGLARRLVPGASAVGRRLRFFAFPESAWTIVGVVGDVKTSRLDLPAPPTIYYSHLQGAENRMTVVVKARAGEERALLEAIHGASRSIDPAMPVYESSMMQDKVAASPAIVARRYPLTLIGAFAVAALVLAVIGVYGVIAYSVVQRRKELAVRMALGASNPDVVRLVLRRGLGLVAAGVALGVPAALLLSRSLRALLFGITTADATTYVVVITLLAAVTVVASLVPAIRATTVDPVSALRAD